MRRGSPPRVRGTAYAANERYAVAGITPACAGNRTTPPIPAAARRGSPPRVRGTVVDATWEQVVGRITPACAGNSCALPKLPQMSRDHPRVCGEQGLALVMIQGKHGSPPRVRGTVHIPFPPHPGLGITPACAGNSLRVRACDRHPQDHPRVCGEQYVTSSSPGTVVGSPPRVRGTDPCRTGGNLDAGITPACAGNRQSAWSTSKTI